MTDTDGRIKRGQWRGLQPIKGPAPVGELDPRYCVDTQSGFSDPGFVYILRERERWGERRFTDRAKIGKAKSPRLRVWNMKHANPHKLVCVGAFESNYYSLFEEVFHAAFESIRIPDTNEWFWWTAELRAACENPPPKAAQFVSPLPLVELHAVADIDLEAREAEPLWRPAP